MKVADFIVQKLGEVGSKPKDVRFKLNCNSEGLLSDTGKQEVEFIIRITADKKPNFLQRLLHPVKKDKGPGFYTPMDIAPGETKMPDAAKPTTDSRIKPPVSPEK